MGFLDKARDLIAQHGEKVEGGLDKVADMVDEKTGGKYADHIDKGQEAAKGFIAGDEGQTPPPAIP